MSVWAFSFYLILVITGEQGRGTTNTTLLLKANGVTLTGLAISSILYCLNRTSGQSLERSFWGPIKGGNVIVALYIVAILWMASGTFLIVYTEGTKEVLKKLVFIEKVRILAIFPIGFGIILIAGALAYSQLFWLCLVLGMLAFMKGLYVALGPLSHIRALIDWWFTKASDSAMRLCGLIAFVLGIAILSNLR